MSKFACKWYQIFIFQITVKRLLEKILKTATWWQPASHLIVQYWDKRSYESHLSLKSHIMPCLPFLLVVTFFVAISTIPAVYYLFEETSSFKEGVSKIVESESNVLSGEGSNVTYQSVNEDPDILVIPSVSMKILIFWSPSLMLFVKYVTQVNFSLVHFLE